MNTLMPVLVGFVFGALLQRAGMSRYDRIVEVYRFRDLAVMEFLLSALVTGALGILAARSLGFIDAVPVPATALLANLTGGTVFGVGMALSGFCPGTIAAGAGEGRLDYLVPGSLGLLSGSLAFGASYPSIVGAFSRAGALGTVTLPAWLGFDPWLLLVLLAEVALLFFYWIERVRRTPGRA
jgi:hypothetical protein